jgi:hypothetical protein
MSTFYRTIDYPNYFNLQQQLVRYALELDLVHSYVPNYHTPQNLSELFVHVPIMLDLLDKLEVTPLTVGWTVSTMNTQSKIHIDRQSRNGRIEFPVIGCAYGYTAFYSAPVTGIAQQKNGIEYWLCDEERAQEVERFTLTEPTFMRVDKPYITRVTRVHVRRISLGIVVNDVDTARFINL